ncbi:MAG: D-alanyl-D-alanine carboxypeptidase [Eubacteriales bacterium]|nr:D-alanyl-D-alanine carboxypeptidase [Eubacteriales bacterium]
MRKALVRLGVALTVAMIAVSGVGWAFPAARAEAAQAGTEISYQEPKLSSDAPAYDETHPENLTEDQLYAKSAILIEASSGEVIFEKNADDQMAPASTTKILTTLLGIQLGDMNATVTMDSVAANIPTDSSSIPLAVGETISFKDLLYATMVRSGNEGANLIAETVSGNIDAFVELMNQAAQAYGCTGTHYANPNGLPDDNHYTTARDMAKIARVAMQDETFRSIAKTYAYSLPKSNLNRARALVGTSGNWLNPGEDNAYYYPYATGIKTGYHSRAGYCYVGSAEKDGVSLISVVFYTSIEGRWTDTKKLMEYGFSQFVSVTPVELYAMNPTTIQTTGYSMDDTDIGRLQLNIVPMADTRTVHIVATKTEVESLARDLKASIISNYTRENFAAPITQGEEFGTLTYYPTDGGSAVIYQLVASRSIARREDAPKSIEEIEAETYADPNPFPPLSVELAAIVLLPFLALFLLIRLLWRITHKGGRPGKRSRVPKPGNRYFR